MNDLHLVVGLSDGRYALPLTSVREAIRVGRVTRVPGAPSGVIGVINMRGEFVAVLDADILLGQGGGADAETAVVVEVDGTRAGIAVRQLFDVVSLPLGLEPADGPALRGSSLFEDESLGVIDVASLLRQVGGGAAH